MKNRKANRKPGYNYSSPGIYFITICSKNRDTEFGNIEDGIMKLNSCGEIIKRQWLWLEEQYNYIKLDEFIIMPDHVHGIVIITRVDDLRENISETGHCILETGNCISDTGNCILETGNCIFETGHCISDTGHCVVGTGRDLSLREDTSPRNIHQTIKPLSQIIGAFKTTSSKNIHLSGNVEFKWQRSFYDRIIRTDKDLFVVRTYIKNNPLRYNENYDSDLNFLVVEHNNIW